MDDEQKETSDEEVDEQGWRGPREDESDEPAEGESEVDEQGARPRFREDESDEPPEDDNSDVDEQRFMSDASLKQRIAPIEAPLRRLA